MTATGLAYSPELEREVVSAYLMNPDVCEDLERMLEAEDFTTPAVRATWTAARELRQRDGWVDVVMMLESHADLGPFGGAAALTRLSTACVAPGDGESVMARARRLREYTRRRRVEQVAAEVLDLTKDRTVTLDTIRARVDVLAGLTLGPGTTGGGMRPIGQLMDDELTRARARAAGQVSDDVVPTGLPSLDLLLKGGLRRSNLVIVGGRPAMGKSAVALQLLLNAARAGRGAALFSLEMPGGEQAQRALASMAGVPLGVLREGGGLSASDLDQLDRAVDDGARLPLWVDDRPTVTLAYLRAEVRRLKCTRPDLAIVAVDYLQLLKGQRTHSSDTRATEVGELSTGLKALAKDEAVVVLALAQLNRNLESRGVDDRRPLPSDLKESGSLEQDADVILFPYRHSVYVPDDPTLTDRMELIIAKQRAGETGTAHARWTGDLQRVEDVAAEQERRREAQDPAQLATVGEIRAQIGRLFAAYNEPSTRDPGNYIRHLTGIDRQRLVGAVDELCRRPRNRLPAPVAVGDAARRLRLR